MKIKPRNAAIYARISIEDETVPKVEIQIAACELLANEHGYYVAKVFKDNGVPATGKRITEGTRAIRPGFDSLLKAVEQGKFDAIISVSGDRLARNYPDGLSLIESCVSGGAVLLLDDDGQVDPSTPAGEEATMALFTGGRKEIRTRSLKQKRRLDAETRKGYPGWGRRPFGFDWVEEENRYGKITKRPLKLHEVEADAIRWAVDHFISPEGSLGGIIREWQARGLKPTSSEYRRRKPVAGDVPFTGEWTLAGVRGILKNVKITGRISHKGQIVVGEDGEPIRPPWEPIVDLESWQAVQDKLADPSRRTSPGRKPRSLGSGIVFCICGLPLRATTIKGKPRGEDGEILSDAQPTKLPGLRCDVSRSRYKQQMRDVPRHVSVRDDVIDPLISQAIASAFLFGAKDLIPGGEVDLRAIENQLAELHKREVIAADVALLGGATGEIAVAEIREIHASRAELEEARINAANRSAQAAMLVGLRDEIWSGERVDIANAATLRDTYRERFEALSLGQKRELVRALLDIRVLPGQGVKVRPERRVEITHKVVLGLNESEFPEELDGGSLSSSYFSLSANGSPLMLGMKNLLGERIHASCYLDSQFGELKRSFLGVDHSLD